jgi:hypothetical protein
MGVVPAKKVTESPLLIVLLDEMRTITAAFAVIVVGGNVDVSVTVIGGTVETTALTTVVVTGACVTVLITVFVRVVVTGVVTVEYTGTGMVVVSSDVRIVVTGVVTVVVCVPHPEIANANIISDPKRISHNCRI